MKFRDIVLFPLRFQIVRAPVVRLLLLKERRDSGLALNPFDASLREDPYPLLQQLQEKDSVHWLEIARGWLITRYDDVNLLLRDSEVSADRSVLANGIDGVWRRGSAFQQALESTVVGLDPPDHTRLRNLVNRAFAPAVVARMRARIEELTAGLLDPAAPRGQLEVMQELADPLPIIVIAEMLGVPIEDYGRLRSWSGALAAALDIAYRRETIDRADRAIADMKAYLKPFVYARRKEARQDLLSALVQAEIEGDRLTEEELYTFCIFLLAAGHETTTNLIGNGLLALLQHPQEWRRLIADPKLVEAAVEELLRYDGPAQLTSRVATKSFELKGKRIREGDFLMLSLAAANRDPQRFTEPNKLNISRPDNRHLAFGLGPHFCIGASLARMEAEIVFSHLARRFPDLRLMPNRPPQRRDRLSLRGLRDLPVLLA
jgi:pimeloyl-[acyl-carrier protein] synthase